VNIETIFRNVFSGYHAGAAGRDGWVLVGTKNKKNYRLHHHSSQQQTHN
jgi:hypothetical protein